MPIFEYSNGNKIKTQSLMSNIVTILEIHCNYAIFRYLASLHIREYFLAFSSLKKENATYIMYTTCCTSAIVCFCQYWRLVLLLTS